MCLSCTVMEIWCLKDNGVTSLTFWCHVTSSVMWPFDSRGSTSYPWSMVTMCLSGTIMEKWWFIDNGVTTLTFWGHMTSSVTWPFDSRRPRSYRWSMVTMHPSSTREPQRAYKNLEMPVVYFPKTHNSSTKTQKCQQVYWLGACSFSVLLFRLIEENKMQEQT